MSHQSIDEQELRYLKKYFSEAALIELLAFCSFISASQWFGAVLGLREGTESQS